MPLTEAGEAAFEQAYVDYAAMLVFTGVLVPAPNTTCHRVANVIVLANIDTGQRWVIEPHDPEWNALLPYADEDQED